MLHSLAVTEPLISLTSMAITNSAFVYCETDSNTSLNLRSQSEGLSALFHINSMELKLNDFLCTMMPIHLQKFVLANSTREKIEIRICDLCEEVLVVHLVLILVATSCLLFVKILPISPFSSTRLRISFICSAGFELRKNL
jgi:hypothetical protein